MHASYNTHDGNGFPVTKCYGKPVIAALILFSSNYHNQWSLKDLYVYIIELNFINCIDLGQ